MFKAGVNSDTDKVIAALPVPRGGVFHGGRFKVHVISAELTTDKVCMYALTAYAVPILVPDEVQTYDNLWDTSVPKATIQAANALDLATRTVDATPEYEPGEVNWAGVFDMEAGPKRLYRRRTLVHATSGGPGLSATGTLTHYRPKDVIDVSIPGGLRASRPTAIMLGLSSPVFATKTTTVTATPTEKEWVMLQFLEDTAIDALKFLIGLFEATSETPYQEAAVFLDKVLMPDPAFTTAADAAAVSWDVTAQGSFTCSVPGTLRARTLDGDR